MGVSNMRLTEGRETILFTLEVSPGRWTGSLFPLNLHASQEALKQAFLRASKPAMQSCPPSGVPSPRSYLWKTTPLLHAQASLLGTALNYQLLCGRNRWGKGE